MTAPIKNPNGLLTTYAGQYQPPGIQGPTPMPINPGIDMGTGGTTPRTYPNLPGSQVTGIQPGQNDLRGTQITPQASPRLQTSQSQTDAARNQVAGFNGFSPYQAVGAQQSGAVTALNQQAQQALGTGMIPYSAVATASPYLTSAAQAGQGITGGIQLGNLPGYQGNYGSVAAGSYNPSADTTAARGNVASTLGNVLQAPDRAALAAQAYDLMLQQQQPQRAADIRALGQNTAALGRVGSGLYNTQLSDVQSNYDRLNQQARQGLALDAAQQSLADRQAQLAASQGVFGQFAGQDVTNAGVQQGLRNEQRSERQFGVDTDTLRNQIAAQQAGLQLQNAGLNQSGSIARSQAANQAFNNALNLGQTGFAEGESNRNYGINRAGALSALGQTQFGQDQSLRNEARTEGDRRLGYDQATLNAQRGVFGDLGGYENQLYNQEAAGRGELRGERGYQDQLAQQGITNAMQQAILENQTQGQDAGQYFNYLNSLGSLGGQYDPTGVLSGQAANYQNQANQGFAGLGDLANEFVYSQMLNNRGTPNAGYPVTPSQSVPAGGGLYGNYYTQFPSYGQRP